MGGNTKVRETRESGMMWVTHEIVDEGEVNLLGSNERGLGISGKGGMRECSPRVRYIVCTLRLQAVAIHV